MLLEPPINLSTEPPSSPSSTMLQPSSIKSRKGKRNRPKQEIKNRSLPSTSTTMAPSTSSVVSSTPILKTKIYVSLLSSSTIASSASNILAPSTLLMKPSTPIPEIYDGPGLLQWGISEGLMGADPDERQSFIKWALHKVDIATYPAPEERKRFLNWTHSSSTMAAHDEPKRRFLKWPHSTSTMVAPDRWSLQEEISKPFETAMKLLQEEIMQKEQNRTALRYGHLEDEFSYTDIKQEHLLYTCQKGMHGVYQCQNVLWIWPKLRTSIVGGPREVGLKIKEKFPESDMIEGRPSINDLGYVTIELSGKWIAKRIHKMLKDGIDTWAPKLPVERVIVDYLSMEEEMHADLFRRHTIGYVLMSILEYSKVDVTIGHPRTMTTHSKRDKDQKELNRWFPNEDHVALGYQRQRVDWILYVTPVWKREYIEKHLTDIEECIIGNRHTHARTSYAGYRSCTTEMHDKLLDKAKTRVAEQGEDSMLLGYTAEAVLDCVFTYIYLKKHRLAECKFDINDELLKEEGNTFLHLLYTLAKLRRITNGSREDINELKKASELILGKDEGWENGEERMLGFKLLEFTETLKESCLCVLPHILCEYLYDLSKKFNSYYSSMCKVGSITETSTLLLCEATAVVMEKCFHLLGITPTSSFFRSAKVSVTKTPLPLSLKFASAKPPIDVNVWDPPGNSRFEVFSFHASTALHLGSDKHGKLFGAISVSDKYGLVSDGESHFYEPDFGHVPLFNHSWCNPINPTDWGIVYLGNPSSRHSVPFSSSIEIRMELYVVKNEDACYQLCNHKIKLDLLDFWDNKKADSACGELVVEGEEGYTGLFYILLKDAVDAALEVKFETKTPDREVCGCVLAYYGDEFLNECKCLPSLKYNYMALLFRPINHVLEPGEIQLIKSGLAVPTKGSLIIKAYLEDAKSGKVIMNNSYKFKSQLSSCSVGTIDGIEGEDCCLDLKVNWKYQA